MKVSNDNRINLSVELARSHIQQQDGGHVEAEENERKGCSSVLVVNLDEEKESESPLLDSKSQMCWESIRLKDRGYSWVVLLAMVTSNIITAGYVRSFGVMFTTILIQYPDTSGMLSGMMMGLLSGCRCMMAPVAGAFNSAYGERQCMLVGTILCVTGLISSCFCTSVLQLAVTLGAMMGVGLCFIEACQVVIINNYFESNLAMANGLRVCGNPLGGMLFPFLLLFCTRLFGSRMMRLVIAGLFLNILVIIMVIRPFDTHKKIQILKAMKSVYGKVDSASEQKRIYSLIKSRLPEASRPKKNQNIEFHFLKNVVYLLFIAVAIFIPLAIPLVNFYVPIYGQKIGFTNFQNSFILGFQSTADFFFRILVGFVSDKFLLKKIHGFITCLAVGGFGAMIIPFCSKMWHMLCSVVLYSLGIAGYYTYLNVVLSEQFGKSSIATTWGFVRLVQGFFCFIHPPLLGLVVDGTRSFTIPFLLMGSGMVVSALLMCFEPLVIRLTRSNVVVT